MNPSAPNFEYKKIRRLIYGGGLYQNLKRYRTQNHPSELSTTSNYNEKRNSVLSKYIQLRFSVSLKRFIMRLIGSVARYGLDIYFIFNTSCLDLRKNIFLRKISISHS